MAKGQGKLGPRLSIHSSGAPAEIDIPEHGWESLENELGANLSPQQRQKIIEMCNIHLMFREAENAATWADVRKLFNRNDKTVTAFSLFAWGTTLEPISDAGSQLEALIKEKLAQYPARFRLQDGSVQDVILDMEHLSSVAQSLICSMRKVKEHISEVIANGPSGHMPGSCFRDFLQKLHKWAKAERLPAMITLADDLPGPFSNFALALHAMFPLELQEGIEGAGAIAANLKRYKSGSKLTRKKKRNLLP